MSIISIFSCTPGHPAARAVFVNPNNGVVFINRVHADTEQFREYLRRYLDPILIANRPRSHIHELCRRGICGSILDGIVLFAAASIADPKKYRLLTDIRDDAFRNSDPKLRLLCSEGILKEISDKLFPYIMLMPN